MRICAECFKAEDWIEHIRAYGKPGICGCCGKTSDKTLDVSDKESIAYFALYQILNLYEPCINGKPLAELIQQDFELMQDVSYVQKFVDDFLSDADKHLKSYNSFGYRFHILKPIEEWKKLKEKLKYQFRFFSGKDVDALSWKDYFEYNKEILPNESFFRGRTNEKEDVEYKTVDELCMPPREKTPNGRANPHGIPCLYLTKSPETTIYELRSVYGDKISIGEFKTKETLRIVDFDKKPSLFEAFENDSLETEVKGYFLKKHIGEELSKPMRRYDFKDLEYVSTQFVCEYVKTLGFDGIIFNSAVHKGGKNLVLFSDKKVQFVGAIVKTVGEANMQFL